MNKVEIVGMLMDVFQEADYDLYKDLFVHPEDKEESDETVHRLVEIVESHLEE